jgi:hypothetical protein
MVSEISLLLDLIAFESVMRPCIMVGSMWWTQFLPSWWLGGKGRKRKGWSPTILFQMYTTVTRRLTRPHLLKFPPLSDSTKLETNPLTLETLEETSDPNYSRVIALV